MFNKKDNYSDLKIDKKIAAIAKSHIYSYDWSSSGNRGSLSIGEDKSSLFVHEVLNEAGILIPLQKQGLFKYISFIGKNNMPNSVEQWKNNNLNVDNFKIVSKPQEGDIAVHYQKEEKHDSKYLGIVAKNKLERLGIVTPRYSFIKWESINSFFKREKRVYLRYVNENSK